MRKNLSRLLLFSLLCALLFGFGLPSRSLAVPPLCSSATTPPPPTATTNAGGLSWSDQTGPISRDLMAATYDGQAFVAVGYDTIARSVDGGMTWASQTPGGLNVTLKSVAYNGTLFVAVGDNGNIWTSSNGCAWFPTAGGVTSSYLVSVAFAGSQWIAVGNSGTVLVGSADGSTWTSQTVPGYTSDLRSIAYGAGRWVAVSRDDDAIYSTDNGTSWTQSNVGSGGSLRSLIYADGQFIAGGFPGIISYSTDGVTWTAASWVGPAGESGITGFASGSGRVLATHSGNNDGRFVVLMSTDHQAWQPSSLPTMRSLFGITYGGGRFVVVGGVGLVLVGQPASLVFTTEPTGSHHPGQALGTQPVVSIVDANGDPIVTATDTITLSATNGGSLSCDQTSVAAVAGVATFTGCKLAAPGNHTLIASTPGLLDATSASFTVGPVAPLIEIVHGKPVNFRTPLKDLIGQVPAAPKLSGYGAAGDIVRISIGNHEVGTATVSSVGQWLYDFGSLPDGTYDAVAVIDVGGMGFTFTVDTKAPAVGIDSRVETNKTQPALAGTAEVGSLVSIYIDDQLVATVRPNDQGQWSYQLVAALQEGQHALKVTATDKAGNEGVAKQSTLTVKTTQPEIATDALPEAVSDQAPTVSGKAEPGASIELYLSGGLAGWTKAAADGTWHATLPKLEAGIHYLIVQATDAAGNVSRTKVAELIVQPSQQ